MVIWFVCGKKTEFEHKNVPFVWSMPFCCQNSLSFYLVHMNIFRSFFMDPRGRASRKHIFHTFMSVLFFLNSKKNWCAYVNDKLLFDFHIGFSRSTDGNDAHSLCLHLKITNKIFYFRCSLFVKEKHIRVHARRIPKNRKSFSEIFCFDAFVKHFKWIKRIGLKSRVYFMSESSFITIYELTQFDMKSRDYCLNSQWRL